MQQREGQEKSCALRYDETRRVGRANPGEGVAQRACGRHRGIGEGGRGGEPIHADDVGPPQQMPLAACDARAAAPDHRQQAERCYHLDNPLRKPCARMLRELLDRQIEDDMRQPFTEDRADDLSGDVSRHRVPA